MPIATFRGEKTVGELADKLFVRLTPRQREKAEAALLRANPQLSDPKRLPEGTILRVPDLPELRAKTNRSLENPDDQIARQIADALGALDQRLAERHKLVQRDLKADAAVLKQPALRKALSDEPALAALAGEVGKTLGKRAEELAEQGKTVSVALREATRALGGKR